MLYSEASGDKTGNLKIRINTDLEEAARLWIGLSLPTDLFGCWQIRNSFHESFGRPLHMVVAERGGKVCGFLALSRIEEEDYFGAFPGETWNGQTWLEQNTMPSSSADVAAALWDAAPENTVVRYVEQAIASGIADAEIDETGYLFHPSDYNWDFDEYWKTFSGKSRKRLSREIGSLGDIVIGPSEKIAGDIEWMFRVNIAEFGNLSYFSDYRFVEAFEKMIGWLSSSGMLRVTTATIGGVRAAVDLGAVFNSRYTVMAGATSPEFPGIAKAINLYHIRVSCQERFSQTDFLCGDFGWKERFHLTPRPLYVLSTRSAGYRLTVAAEGKDRCV
ncbi:MAG: GNAT family N-acetyltransferase [Candidatus Krumholzibacteriota bacterium]|nr:GNAT family N-acetyltransferase [Candidatus Krumholzibacteriota bacterium]